MMMMMLHNAIAMVELEEGGTALEPIQAHNNRFTSVPRRNNNSNSINSTTATGTAGSSSCSSRGGTSSS